MEPLLPVPDFIKDDVGINFSVDVTHLGRYGKNCTRSFPYLIAKNKINTGGFKILFFVHEYIYIVDCKNVVYIVYKTYKHVIPITSQVRYNIRRQQATSRNNCFLSV